MPAASETNVAFIITWCNSIFAHSKAAGIKFYRKPLMANLGHVLLHCMIGIFSFSLATTAFAQENSQQEESIHAYECGMAALRTGQLDRAVSSIKFILV